MSLLLSNFSPIQRRMILLLDDAEMHTREELVDCLQDTQATPKNIHFHLTMLRKILRPQGMDIIAQGRNRAIRYRMIRNHIPMFSSQVLSP